MEFREQQGTISFEEAERRYAELKRHHDAGQINEEQFDTERQRLLVRDDEGRWWAKSRQTGQWLYHDGSGSWIEAAPPIYRRVSLEDSPVWSEQDPPEQVKQGPTAARAPGSRSRLLIGLGVLGIVIVVGLIAAFAYYFLDTQQGKPDANVAVSPGPSPSPSSPSSSAGSEKTMYAVPKAGSQPEESAVEDAVKGHYGAIGAGDFEKAYSYFGPTLRNQLQNNEQGWINSEKSNQITSTTFNSLKVNSVSGNQANATVDVTSHDKSGAPRFLLTWDLVKENGQWKLDDQVSGQRID